MRTILRAAGVITAVVVVALWFFGGPNLGWTKNAVPHKQRDPVTDLEVDVYEKQWVPGVDFLVGGLLVAAVPSCASFFLRKKKPSQDARPSTGS